MMLQVSLSAGPLHGLSGPSQHRVHSLVTSVEVGSNLVTETLGNNKADASLIVCLNEEPFVHSQSFPCAVERTKAGDFK